MSALDVLKELTASLSYAGKAEDIGKALFEVSQHFGFTSALIVDMSRYFNRLGPAIVFSAAGRQPLEVFDTERPFANHPFTVRAQASDKPFVMSRVRADLGNVDDVWWDGLPPHLRDTDGIVVPVHDDGDLAWYSGFVGLEPDLSQRALAVMSAAVHAGHARFVQLLDDKAPRSPLTARESECLRWVGEGKTDVEVGKILDISPRTVRFHINNAKVKLGVATRIQAVARRVSGM